MMTAMTMIIYNVSFDVVDDYQIFEQVVRVMMPSGDNLSNSNDSNCIYGCFK